MLEIATRIPGPRLTRKTLNRHASAISGLFTWAKKHGHWAGGSPATGFVDKRGRRRGSQASALAARGARAAVRLAGLDRLRERWPARGARAHSDPGCALLRAADRAVHGLAAGGDRELRAEDVREDTGIFAVDVIGNEAGRVKEENSNRTVPVHPVLVRLGWMAHVQAIRARGGGALWPELRRGGVDGKLSVGLSKWFTRYCQDLGVKAPDLTFHSLRQNLASALHGLGVPETTASDILGHEHATLSYRLYSQGAKLRTLYDAIARVEYGLEMERNTAQAVGSQEVDASGQASGPSRRTGAKRRLIGPGARRTSDRKSMATAGESAPIPSRTRARRPKHAIEGSDIMAGSPVGARRPALPARAPRPEEKRCYWPPGAGGRVEGRGGLAARHDSKRHFYAVAFHEGDEFDVVEPELESEIPLGHSKFFAARQHDA